MLVVFCAFILCGTLTVETRLIQAQKENAINPPPSSDYALMARYIIHNTDWLSIATISTQDTIKGYPFVSLKSLSDGPVKNSTGVPYLYMTDMDVSGKDTLQNSKVTVMATLAATSYCNENEYDPQDPRCAKVILSGIYLKVNSSTPEYTFGRQSLFEKHPAMKDWPEDHGFYVAKVDLKQILVLDFFGGIHSVKPEDYFRANLTSLINLDAYFQSTRVLVV